MQDVATLNTFFQSNFAATPEEKQLSVSGKNWGEVDLNGMYIPLTTFAILSMDLFESMSTFLDIFFGIVISLSISNLSISFLIYLTCNCNIVKIMLVLMFV